MKLVDGGEFFQAKEKKEFGEYKEFKAEQYYVFETKNNAKEIIDINETYQENESSAKNTRQIEKNNNDELRKQLEKASKTSSQSGNGTSTATSHAHAVSESSVLVGSGTAAVTVTAAAVVISVTSAGIGLSSVAKYVQKEVGNDYVSLNINLDKIMTEYDKSYGLNDSNFLLKFNEDGNIKKEIPLKSGNHSYVVGNLIPLKEYSYIIECKNPIVGNTEVIYKSSFTTKEYSDPKGVKDEVNNYVSFINPGNEDGATSTNTTALLNYSIYLSDYEKQYDFPTFYVCSSLQSNPSDLTNILFSSSELNNENYFKGQVENIIFDNVYVYIVGEKNSNKEFLYSDVISIEFPIENTSEKYAFQIDESMENNSSTIDKIKLTGSLVKISELYPFRVRFALYCDDTLLEEKVEGLLVLDKENLTYEVSCRSYYGTKKFKYTIYMLNPNNEEIIVYESSFKEYSVDQSFNASYEKVEPKDAAIEYNSSYIKINVPTNFTSEFSDIYYYTLKVVNSSNIVYGTYEGTNNAEIIIDSLDGLDSISFIYTDMGRFANGEIEFGSYTSNGEPFSYPYIYLENGLGISGDNYVLTYYCDMVYDYSLASAKISTVLNNERYEWNISPLSYQGKVELTGLIGEFENVQFNVEISFVDNQSSHEIKTVTQTLDPIQLQYEFRLKMVEASLSKGDGSNYVTRFAFDNVIPSSYQVNIKDDANLIDMNIDPSRKEFFVKLGNGTVYNFTFTIIDTYGNEKQTGITCKLDDATATSSYQSFTCNFANPGDTVVTYNEDGTINMYREVNYEMVNSSNYLNAMIFNSNDYDSETSTMTYVGRIENFVQEKYSIIENLPRDIYCFNYYQYYKLDEVYYVMYEEYPSGSVGFMRDQMHYEVAAADGQTKIVISNTNYGHFDNKIVVNGVEYQYYAYDESQYDSLVLFIDGEITVNELKVYFTEYDGNYDTYNNEIQLNGSRYDEIIIS